MVQAHRATVRGPARCAAGFHPHGCRSLLLNDKRIGGLNKQIAAGTVILFDEYFFEEGGKETDDEHRALLDYCAKYDRKFEYLWRTRHIQVAVKITS